MHPKPFIVSIPAASNAIPRCSSPAPANFQSRPLSHIRSNPNPGPPHNTPASRLECGRKKGWASVLSTYLSRLIKSGGEKTR